jgi:hypothetical protein
MKKMRVASCEVESVSWQSGTADEVKVVLELRRDDTHQTPVSQFSDEVHNAIADFLDEQVRRESEEG